LTVGVAEIDVAKALNVPAGSPIALVRRNVFDAKGDRIYAARIHFPANVVRLETTLLAKK
ncbi:MAG: hypothetical protein ACRCWJ_04040, partial [Casimicrobium sp.]